MTLDLDTATLADAVAALKRGDVSSIELLDAQLDRIDTFNPSVNAVVAFDIDRARTEAAAADAGRASGEYLGPLQGVPLTIKDTYETAGTITTAGSPTLAEYRPDSDADVVQGIRQAGGVLFGKTNVPLFAGDHQTYNDVYGLTRNAWDPERTVGGSSGGAGVAVACGFSLGEYGSDIGGSIRVPAHFNGVFGLKPSWGVVSERGHIPGPPGTLGSTDLWVMGPLGRSIDDLALMLDASLVVGGMGGVPGAHLPAGDRVDVGALRIGLWSDDPIAPVDAATRIAVEGFASTLDGAGCSIDAEARPAIAASDLHDLYGRLLFPVMAAGLPASVLDRLRPIAAGASSDLDAGDPSSFAERHARDSVSTHTAWLRAAEQRAKAQASWARLFERVDVVAMPVCQTQAFLHDTERSYADRTVDVDGEQRAYHELLFWAGLATMPLLPSVVLPLGPVNGLPMGVQLVGPRWSDRRLLAIGAAISETLGLRFSAPPLLSG